MKVTGSKTWTVGWCGSWRLSPLTTSCCWPERHCRTTWPSCGPFSTSCCRRFLTTWKGDWFSCWAWISLYSILKSWALSTALSGHCHTGFTAEACGLVCLLASSHGLTSTAWENPRASRCPNVNRTSWACCTRWVLGSQHSPFTRTQNLLNHKLYVFGY